MPANIGEMFYYGEMPWHEEGYKLDQPATLDEALDTGGLDWEVMTIPLQTVEVNGLSSPVPMRKAVVRTDRPPGHPGRVLGVVYGGFKPLQNREGARIFDTIFGRGERVYHTGGYLGNGEVIWLLARLPAEITLQGEDIVEPYMLFTNSHNGSVAIDLRLTAVRVVCQNTLSLALSKRDQRTVFKHSHQGNYDKLTKEIDQHFEFAISAVKLLEKNITRLSDTRCVEDAFTQFIYFMFPDPPVNDDDDPVVQIASEKRRKIAEAERREVGRMWVEGPGSNLPSANGTWWGALNAVTAYVDHNKPTRWNRYAYALFGRGAAIKRKAYDYVVQRVGNNE